MPPEQQADLFAGAAHAPPQPPPALQPVPWWDTPAPAQPLPPLEGEQLAAMDAALAFLSRQSDRRHFGLHGLAGTGKTTVLAALARELPDAVLLSPTSKAAGVLSRKTGRQVLTLHKALYVPEQTRSGVRFHNAVRPGEFIDGIALLDEASMVDRALAADLLETGLRVIACGDPGQLPPVRGEQFFSEANFVLTEVRRQAKNSGIIREAHAVRAGLPYADDGAFRIVDRGDTAVLDNADIVLCWRNEIRHRLNRFMRRRRGIPPQAPLQAGEPLICLENRGDELLNERDLHCRRKLHRQRSSARWANCPAAAVRMAGTRQRALAPEHNPVRLGPRNHRSQGARL